MKRDDLFEEIALLRDLGYSHLRIPEATRSSVRVSIETGTVDDFDLLERRASECTSCKLAGGRTTVVFGTGNRNADLMFVGEAPGRDEDLQGLPFVGKAGKLLTDIIRAMKLRREDVYIANVIKCRPPNNRNPELDELEACREFIESQISLVSPRVIVTLGKVACQSLLQNPSPISAMRGEWQRYGDIPVMPTYHPAFLLRNPAAKREVWADMKKVMQALGIPID